MRKIRAKSSLLAEIAEKFEPAFLQFDKDFSKVSLVLVLSVFTGLVMSGTSQGERLHPGMVIGLFAAIAVSGSFLLERIGIGAQRPRFICLPGRD